MTDFEAAYPPVGVKVTFTLIVSTFLRFSDATAASDKRRATRIAPSPPLARDGLSTSGLPRPLARTAVMRALAELPERCAERAKQGVCRDG